MKIIKRFQDRNSQKNEGLDLNDICHDLKYHMRQVRLDRLLARQR